MRPPATDLTGRRWLARASLVLAVAAAGCGYSTQSLLPANYRKIYIEPFTNRLAITEESTEMRRFVTSLPRLEEDVTNAVIKRFIFDGHLRVTPNRHEADLVLTGELADFHRQALRLADGGAVEEYRLNLVANLALRDPKSGELVWEESSFVGDSTYFLTGPTATSEAAAVDKLLTDFAKRVVERTIENW
ncbi:MAG: hypothetical protein HY600_05365 [Candidatus Omnitrophica bacterium]|nr:hypothetical protein [Candidatus Omnitrophota bacterium]